MPQTKAELREQSHQYYQEHKVRCQEYGRLYYREHRKERCEYSRRWLEEHKQEASERKSKCNLELKQEVMAHYSTSSQPTCARCGITDIDVLSIDHINGRGSQHRRSIGRGTHFYYWLRHNDYPEGFQVLCYNCNQKKKVTEDRIFGKQEVL